MSQFGDGYVGTAEDSARIRRQNKQRDEQRKKFEELSKQSQDRINSAGLRQFGASTTEALEHAFKNETIGLVTKAEFVQKRTTLQERIEEEQRKRQREDEEAAANEKERRKRERLNGAFKPKLSFYEDDMQDDGMEEATEGTTLSNADKLRQSAAACSPIAANIRCSSVPDTKGVTEELLPSVNVPRTFAKLGKDPSVRSDFLPDKDRERQEEDLRKQLKKEWIMQQEKIKAEPVEITYSYWNGTGHRRKVTVKQGDSISGFLKAARDQLAPEFRELRATSVDNLLFIKEDLIMPHHCTFHELIVSKARGKSGPLFNFTVHEDIRLVNDASIEKGDTHAGKVVERHWYDRNKHIFPANRWERTIAHWCHLLSIDGIRNLCEQVWDPDKNYETYTIYGGE